MSQPQRTLVILKPDAVQRQLVGEILGRFEAKGFKIVGLKMVQISQELARRMYAVHEGKEFYEPLVEFMTASPQARGRHLRPRRRGGDHPRRPRHEPAIQPCPRLGLARIGRDGNPRLLQRR